MGWQVLKFFGYAASHRKACSINMVYFSYVLQCKSHTSPPLLGKSRSFSVEATKKCPPSSLEVWEASVVDDRLSCNSTDGHHCQSAIHEFGFLFLLVSGFILRLEGVPSKVCEKEQCHCQSAFTFKKDITGPIRL